MAKNEYEILYKTNDFVILRSIRPICLQKAKEICKYISNSAKIDIFWYNNTESDEIEIYVSKKDFEVAKQQLAIFEANYTLSLRKTNMIAKYRHKR